ncbi:MAG: chromosomal replication initiator protein DnaA [Dehalococcoidia bacterium]|nr:chromosomal replication initiator protein DnaA [Dehalococcoidia bacterium]
MPDRSVRDIWEEALSRLRKQMSAAAYNMWLAGTAGVSLTDREFTVSVPSEYTQHWIQGSLLPIMERTVSDVLKRPVTVVLEVASGVPIEQPVEPATPELVVERPARSGPSFVIGARPDPQLTFDSFVNGDNTKLAYAAATKVANDHNGDYNPLVLYGPPGLGKTHLLHAIANEAHGHGRTTLLATSEQFVHDFVTSVQKKTTAGFRERYRSPDILMIDDVQFICGKAKSEEALLHTCGALLRAGQQIVVSADRAPDALDFRNPRLAARLRAGLPVDVRPPNRRTRLHILAFKAARYDLETPDDVLAYLANRQFSSINQLKGDLTRVIAHATLLDQPLTLELARQALSATSTNPDPVPLTIEAIIRTTAAYRQLTPADITGRSRARPSAEARHLAVFLASRHTNHSLAYIGKAFGNRDHTTVMHSIRRMERALSTDAKLRADAEAIIQIASSTFTGQ